MNAVVWYFEHSLALPFFEIEMKTEISQSHGHCLVFQICLHIECSTLTASSFRIWNSSAEIPSPPLDLFIVMLPKAYLTSHSRMSDCRLMTTLSWLSKSLRSFLYSFFVYSCHLFLTSTASFTSLLFLSFIEPIFAWNVPLVSLVFLKWSLALPILLFFSISLPSLFNKAFYLWNSAFSWVCLSFSPLPFTSLLFSPICKASSDNQFAFLHFFFLGMVLITASCTMSHTSIHSSSGTLSDLVPWIYLSLPLYNRKGFDLGHTWMV